MTRLPVFIMLHAITLWFIGAVVAQEPKGGETSDQDLGSFWVELRSGGLVGKEGGALSIMLFLDNKTDQPLWVRAEIHSPDLAQNCTITRPIAARGAGQYVCPQKSIVADKDYPISVDTFADEALNDRLESKSTKMSFRLQDITALMRYIETPRKPITLTDVWYRTEESQMLIAYKEVGTLEITSERLVFTHSGDKVEIPLTSVQRLIPRKRFAIFDANEWVVIEYRVAGKDLVAAFKPAAFVSKTSHDEILKAIRNALP
jgi:hypothetical protein